MKCLKRNSIELRYEPTKINPEALEVLKSFYEENNIKGGSIGMTLEYAYREMKGHPAPPLNRTIMSKECQKWCGADLRDGHLPFARFIRGFNKGVNHTWATVLQDIDLFEDGKFNISDIINTIPTY